MRHVPFPALALVVAAILQPALAHASGTLSCTIETPALEMNLEGVVSHGLGEQLTEVRGDIKVNDPFLSSDLKAVTLSREDMTQFWLTGRDLKLRLYRDSTKEPGESLELIVEATGKGEDGLSYRGTFKGTFTKLEAGSSEAKTKAIKGKVTCSSE